MDAKQIVEFIVVARILVGAEPPEPVTAFGHVQRLEGGWCCLRRGIGSCNEIPRPA